MTSVPSKSRSIAWTVWIVVSVFYAYQYVLRVMPNIMLEDIMKQFGISAATFGQFSGVYYIGYSLMHLPLGIMLDRFGPRNTMVGCILLSVIGLTPLLFATHWAYPIIGRLLIGMGSSAAILGIFKIVRMMFSEDKFPRMLSLSVTIGLIGAIYGGGPISYMREAFGYEFVVNLAAMAGIGLTAITFWLLPNEKSETEGSVISDIKEVITNARVMGSCLFAGLMVGPLEGFADVWGTAFLKNVYGFDATLAASLPSMVFIGMCFGSPVLSWVAEKVGSYLATIIGAGVMMAASFYVLTTWQLAPTAVSINFTIVGVCCAYQILAIYKASTYVREKVVGLTTAVANMIIMVFGYAFHTIIGNVVNYMGGPTAPEALVFGVAVIPIALCMGTAGFILLWTQEKRVAIQVQQP